eukprot:1201501-Pleurochrysis_carterae.AAC.1
MRHAHTETTFAVRAPTDCPDHAAFKDAAFTTLAIADALPRRPLCCLQVLYSGPNNGGAGLTPARLQLWPLLASVYICPTIKSSFWLCYDPHAVLPVSAELPVNFASALLAPTTFWRLRDQYYERTRVFLQDGAVFVDLDAVPESGISLSQVRPALLDSPRGRSVDGTQWRWTLRMPIHSGEHDRLDYAILIDFSPWLFATLASDDTDANGRAVPLSDLPVCGACCCVGP